MSRRTASLVAWSLVGVAAALALAGMGLMLAYGNVVVTHFLSNDATGVAMFVTSGIVGALVASRLPANPIGWIFIGLASTLAVSGWAEGYVALAEHEGRLGGVTPWVALYAADSYVVLFAAVLLTVLLFPDGHLPTQRWRVVLWAGAAGFALLVPSVVLAAGPLDGYPQFANPAAVDSRVVSWLGVPGGALFTFAAIGAAVSVVVRFRRSAGVERQQLTLLVAAGVVVAMALIVGGPIGALMGSEDLGIAIILLGMLSVPVAIGVAMLRYRLYEVDRVISRTLVYGGLTLILGAAYSVLVVAGQAIFSSFAGGSNLAIAASTLVVAALFLPLRVRLQRVVDRRFYRRRYDAQRTLERFGARLREEIDLELLTADLRGVVDETMQPAHVSLWLRSAR